MDIEREINSALLVSLRMKATPHTSPAVAVSGRPSERRRRCVTSEKVLFMPAP